MISIHLRTRTLKLPNMTSQLTERIHKDGKVSSLTPKKNLFLHSIQNYSVQPNTSEIITCSLSAESFPEGTVAIVEPNPRFEKQTGLCVTSAIVKLNDQKQVSLGILNILPYKVTVPKNVPVAKVTILTAKQAQYLHPINPELLFDHLTKSIMVSLKTLKPKYTHQQMSFGFLHRKTAKTQKTSQEFTKEFMTRSLL